MFCLKVPFEVSVERSGGSPLALKSCLQWLNENGLEEIGIYRIPGSKTVRDEIIRKFDWSCLHSFKTPGPKQFKPFSVFLAENMSISTSKTQRAPHPI